MNSRIEIVNALYPKCQALEALGYTIVGESWGAYLRLSDPIDLEKYSEKISKLHILGYRVESFPLGFADQVLELEVINNPDYPSLYRRVTLPQGHPLWNAKNCIITPTWAATQQPLSYVARNWSRIN